MTILLTGAAGFIGAYTTFSTFVWELYEMTEKGHALRASAYLAASVALGVAAVVVRVGLVEAATRRAEDRAGGVRRLGAVLEQGRGVAQLDLVGRKLALNLGNTLLYHGVLRFGRQASSLSLDRTADRLNDLRAIGSRRWPGQYGDEPGSAQLDGALRILIAKI